MKRLRKLAFVCATCIAITVITTVVPNYSFTPLTAQAVEYIWDDNGIIKYAIYDDHVEVIDCQEDYEGKVEILSEINGFPVTIIAENAFEDCHKLTNIILPDTVITIGNHAFSKCWELINMDIPNSVTSIENNAFYACYDMTNITLSDHLINLGDNAFSECGKLTSVIVPDGVTSIGNYTFNRCISMTSITLPKDITSIGEYALSGCWELKSITIPEKVSSIGANAFYACRSITDIILPDTVTNIGDYAFAECSSLTGITIPDSVTSLGTHVFEHCSVLANIVVPDKFINDMFQRTEGTAWRVENPLYIVDNIIANCDQRAEKVIIPDTVTGINNYAFLGCKSLTKVEIPYGVKVIGDYAFGSCSNLTRIIIPDTVDKIGKNVFNGCDALTIKVLKGSFAEQYAKKQKYKYESVENISSEELLVTYTDLNGKNIKIGDGIPTAVIFGKPTCLNTENTLTSIAQSKWIKSGIIRVIYADIDENDLETVSDFQQKLATNDILFCSTENTGGLYGVSYANRMWDIIGDSITDSVTCPAIAYYDGSGKLLQFTTASKTENEIYQSFMSSYVYLSEKSQRSFVSKHSVKEDSIRTSTYNNNSGVTRHGRVDDLVELKDSAGNDYAVYQENDTIYLICNNPDIDTVKIENPGFMFGSAALDDNDNLYVLWGYDVEWEREVEAIENKEVNLQVIQYDLKGNIQASCPIPIDLTIATNPFNYGNANMQCNRGVLGIFFDVQWAESKSKDGLHHQGAEYASIDLSSMKLLGVSNWEGSHSFGVCLIPTEYGFAGVQRGDADHARGINFNSFYADGDNNTHKKWYDGYLFQDNGKHVLLHASGQYGTNAKQLDGNDTYLSLGGFAKSKSTYALAGKAEDYYTEQPYRKVADGITVRKDMYDVFVQIYDQSFSFQAEGLAGTDRINVDNGEIADRNIVWLAKADEHTGYGNVKIAALKDGSYCVLWERINKDTRSFDGVRYAILNERGYVIRPESELVGARLSNTSIQPIINGDILTWAVADSQTNSIDFYSFDLTINQSDPSAEPLRGDVTLDSTVSVDDAQLTLKAYTERIAGNNMKLNNEQIKAADVNGDGEISVDDAQNILIYYVNNTVAGKVLTWDELLGKKAQTDTAS